MKQKEIMLNIRHKEHPEEEEHFSSNPNTPLRKDAFEMDDSTKIQKIEHHFREIMNIMGLDLNDDSLKGTPHRVAKMFIKEIFRGLDPDNKPSVKLFENKFKYNEMLIEKDINVYSYCEHHFVPIIGKAHVAYISSGKIIGLSKINRIVQYYSKRPQVQERLTVQILNELKHALETDHVAVVIDAKHLCVASRGIEDVNSSTITAQYSGEFKKDERKAELLSLLSIK
jgi:GTP cyclohydrolase IA